MLVTVVLVIYCNVKGCQTNEETALYLRQCCSLINLNQHGFAIYYKCIFFHLYAGMQHCKL